MHPFLRSQTVECLACGARWRVRRIPGRDLRLHLVAGPPELVGVEMALSAWYDEMKRDLAFPPLPVSGITLNTDEQVLLEAQGKLSTQRPNPLFEGWGKREAPRSRAASPGLPGEWGELGEGRLLLTTEHLLWQSGSREVEFRWEHTFSIFLWLFNTLTLQYGAVLYRFELGEENGLKWLTCAGTQARRVAASTGQKLSLSSF